MAVGFIFSLDNVNKVKADNNSETGNFYCIKTGSSTNCPVSRGLFYGEVNGQVLPYQAWEASISARVKGFGNFGPAGGKATFSGCLNSNAAMWSGSCVTFFDYDVGNTVI